MGKVPAVYRLRWYQWADCEMFQTSRILNGDIFRNTYSFTLKVLMRKARATKQWFGSGSSHSGNFSPSHQCMPASLAFQDALSQKCLISFLTGFIYLINK